MMVMLMVMLIMNSCGDGDSDRDGDVVCYLMIKRAAHFPGYSHPDDDHDDDVDDH